MIKNNIKYEHPCVQGHDCREQRIRTRIQLCTPMLSLIRHVSHLKNTKPIRQFVAYFKVIIGLNKRESHNLWILLRGHGIRLQYYIFSWRRGRGFVKIKRTEQIINANGIAHISKYFYSNIECVPGPNHVMRKNAGPLRHQTCRWNALNGKFQQRVN